MPSVSNTDLATAARYLRDAAAYYLAAEGGRTTIYNRARLMRLMAAKFEKKTKSKET